MMPAGLIAEMLMRQRQQSIPDMPQRPPFIQYGYAEPSGKAPPVMPFRDPAQAGPAPPPAGYLAQMYGKGM